MTTSESTSPDLGGFPWHRSCPFSMPDQYSHLREQGPTKIQLATGAEAWVVTRYDEVRQLLTHPDASSDRGHDGYPYYIPVPPQFRVNASFIGWDPPQHTVYRRMAAVSGEFTKRRVQGMKPRMQEIVDGLIDDMLEAGSPVDLVEMLALPVPLTVMCEMLGIPSEDQGFLHQRTDVLFGGGSTAEARATAMAEVNAYLDELAERKEADPGEDLLSKIVLRFREAGLYDRKDLCNLMRLLLNGGHETSAAMIALGTMALIENPEQRAAFETDPDRAADSIEELLRFISPGDLATSRVALSDITVGETVIPEGDGIVILGAAANHDPAEYDRPDELDLSRGSRRHMAFGHGLHYCIGAELARVELAIVLTTLFRRIPDLRLVKPRSELRYKDGNVMYGVYEMPVAW